MKTKFTPLRDYLLVKPVDTPDTTPSGLVLPESSKERPNQGKVVAVGNGQLDVDGKVIPLQTKINDTVLFPKYTGQEIKLEGEKYLIMRETDVFGILSG